jgi:hypothetical protein
LGYLTADYIFITYIIYSFSWGGCRLSIRIGVCVDKEVIQLDGQTTMMSFFQHETSNWSLCSVRFHACGSQAEAAVITFLISGATPTVVTSCGMPICAKFRCSKTPQNTVFFIIGMPV